MINIVIDRSGSTVSDYDVIMGLEGFISDASTELDGYLRRYTSTPINPTIITITGMLTFTRGNNIITGVGSSFLTELKEGDEVRPDGNENVRVIVDEVISDTKFESKDIYYGRVDLTGTATIYIPNVPIEIRSLCRDHASYLLWNRRGVDSINPMKENEKKFSNLIEQIKNGEYRFETSVGREVAQKPTVTSFYSATGKPISKTFTDQSLRDFNP
jgi:phage gp36-like protein